MTKKVWRPPGTYRIGSSHKKTLTTWLMAAAPDIIYARGVPTDPTTDLDSFDRPYMLGLSPRPRRHRVTRIPCVPHKEVVCPLINPLIKTIASCFHSRSNAGICAWQPHNKLASRVKSLILPHAASKIQNNKNNGPSKPSPMLAYKNTSAYYLKVSSKISSGWGHTIGLEREGAYISNDITCL